MKYLVDTSVWIDYINGTQCAQVDFLDTLLENPLAVGLMDMIYMEILQGAKDQNTFDQFRCYFSGQRFYRLQNAEKSHAAAAQIYVDCRRQGITLRSSIDCLIAQCAIEHKLVLLHNDRDFKQMANVITVLEHKFF